VIFGHFDPFLADFGRDVDVRMASGPPHVCICPTLADPPPGADVLYGRSRCQQKQAIKHLIKVTMIDNQYIFNRVSQILKAELAEL